MSAADIIIVLLLAGAFLAGFFQGVIRAALDVAAWAVAFVLGANLRDYVGGYLATQWTNLDPEYNRMVAFGIIFGVVFVGLAVVIQVSTRGPVGATSYPLLDDILGGTLGVTLAILLMATGIVILGTFYGPGAPGATGQGAEWSATLYSSLTTSNVGSLIDQYVVPFLGLIFGAIVPEAVREQMA